MYTVIKGVIILGSWEEPSLMYWSYFFLLFIFIYFLEREGSVNVWLPLIHPLLETWPATLACALIGNRPGNLLVHRPTLNPLSYASQGLFFPFSVKY